MPFAAVIRTVPVRFQQLRKQRRPLRPIFPFNPCHRIATNLLSIVTRQYTSPRRPATPGGITLRKTKPPLSQRREIGSPNIPPVTLSIGIPHIISQNKNNIRPAGPISQSPTRRQTRQNTHRTSQKITSCHNHIFLRSMRSLLSATKPLCSIRRALDLCLFICGIRGQNDPYFQI